MIVSKHFKVWSALCFLLWFNILFYFTCNFSWQSLCTPFWLHYQRIFNFVLYTSNHFIPWISSVTALNSFWFVKSMVSKLLWFLKTIQYLGTEELALSVFLCYMSIFSVCNLLEKSPNEVNLTTLPKLTIEKYSTFLTLSKIKIPPF